MASASLIEMTLLIAMYKLWIRALLMSRNVLISFSTAAGASSVIYAKTFLIANASTKMPTHQSIDAAKKP